MSSISSLNIISVVVPEPKIFLCIPAFAADAAAVYPNGIKTLLANGLITFFIKGNPVFSHGARSLPRNPPDCIILDNWVFDSIISVDELFAKALRRFATCLLLILIFMENYIHHQNYQLYLMIILKLLQFYFLLPSLIY